MSIPQHPETLVIQNQFYPKGLKEIDIWNYYQKVKPQLLKEVIGKNLTFFFSVDLNKIVVMRKAKTPTGFLRLNYKNYETLISGRTISIHTNFNRTSDVGIVDIDISDFDMAKKAAANTYNVLLSCPFVESLNIRFTGKESFHIICNLNKTMYIDSFRMLMRNFLQESEISKIYTIEYKRKEGIPNLDLSSNKVLGGYISLHSLSVLGLKCMEIDRKDIMKFRKEMAKI